MSKKNGKTYVTPGWILGTSSISDNNPVQWDCWGKSTITSLPLALKALARKYLRVIHLFISRT